MKNLRCPKCKSSSVAPPVEGKRKWKCLDCEKKFKVTSKDAGKILRTADEKGVELGLYEPYLVNAILDKQGKKLKKKGKSSKGKKSRDMGLDNGHPGHEVGP